MDARQKRLGPEEALTLARRASRVVAARGAKVAVFDMKKTRPGDEELLAVLLGPSGALRAPALLVADALLVGFDQEAYQKTLG